LRRAIIAFEADDTCGRKVAREAEENRNVRATPAIDGLIFITDDAKVLFRPGEKAEQIVLDAVGILIFVDVNVLEALLPAFADGGPILQEFCGAEKEIVEIERITLRQKSFVGVEDVGDFATIGAEGFGANVRGGLTVIFGVADLLRTLRGVRVSSLMLRRDIVSLTVASWSSSSNMAKLYGRPAAAASRRSRRAQSE